MPPGKGAARAGAARDLGERPEPHREVAPAIGRADATGAGALDETEYLALLEMERREKREREAT